MHSHPYALGLEKNAANHVPLSPLSYLQRSAGVYPNRVAVVYGDLRQTWAQTYERCKRLASALTRSCARSSLQTLKSNRRRVIDSP